jgi:hypothetical protein
VAIKTRFTDMYGVFHGDFGCRRVPVPVIHVLVLVVGFPYSTAQLKHERYDRGTSHLSNGIIVGKSSYHQQHEPFAPPFDFHRIPVLGLVNAQY